MRRRTTPTGSATEATAGSPAVVHLLCSTDLDRRGMMEVVPVTCTNPNCTCSPCLCGDACKCGGGPQLGELERQVMDVLWASYGREVSGREVADALPAYAYTTVATVLNRLSRKGAVRRRVEGRTAHFAAIHTEVDRAAATMREALEDSGDRRATLGWFVGTITPEEATTLRRALERRPERTARRPRLGRAGQNA